MRWTALLVGIFVVLAPLAAEEALQLYAKYVTKRDRLFRSDAQTGWSNSPDLLAERINAAGERWSIRTDQNGQRIIAQNLLAGRDPQLALLYMPVVLTILLHESTWSQNQPLDFIDYFE